MAPVYTISSSTDIAWTAWVEYTASANTTLTWTAWNTSDTTSVNYTAPHQTEEQRLQLARRNERARELLVACLTSRQRRELEARGYFHVETARGRRRYRLAPGRAPIRVHGEDGSQWSYCIHPDAGFPQEDVVLAQKLLLETDEEAFLRIANASRVDVPA